MRNAKLAGDRRIWLLAPVCALAVTATDAASAHDARLFHGTASGGQYLNVTVSSDGAAITAARLNEHCRPGGRRQLVKPNALAFDPIAIGDGKRFAETVRKDGHWTRYRGYVNVTTVVVKVIDAADSQCRGAKQRFVTSLIK